MQSVLFQNPENGYSVLKLRTEGGELVTVVGTIPMTIVGERLVIAGRWGHHPSHGPQFEAEFLERLMPETKAEIFSFLSSRAVKGIGAKTAEKIVSRFGASSLDVLENEPERITFVPYSSLGNPHGLLMVLQVEQLMILDNRKKIELRNQKLGLTDQKLDGNGRWQMLLHSDLEACIHEKGGCV